MRHLLLVAAVLYAALFFLNASATGKITAPVTGALYANEPQPELEEHIYLYFNVTAEEDLAKLTLQINLPRDVETVEPNEPALKVFTDVKAGQTVTFTLAVRNLSLEPQQVTAAAIVSDSPEFFLSRAFLLILNEYDPREAFRDDASEVTVLGDKSVRLYRPEPKKQPLVEHERAPEPPDPNQPPAQNRLAPASPR